MDDRARARWGRLLAGLAVVGAAIGVVVVTLIGRWDFFFEEFGLHNAVLAVGFGLVALVTLGTQPRNGAIWALAWSAFFAALSSAGLAVLALYELGESSLLAPGTTPADLPVGAVIAVQLHVWAWIPAIFILITVFLLLFPDGRPLTARWWWVGRFSIAAMAALSLTFGWLARPSSTLAVESLEETSLGEVATNVAFPVLLTASVLSLITLVLRYRRSGAVVRQQIRWLAWGGVLLVGSIIWLVMFDTAGESAAALVALGGEVLMIASIAIAITRYRLYDIDVVISRSVTYGALALFITGVYVAIVVGIGSLFGQGDEPNLALAIVATAAVALLFEPVRSRLQRSANRFAYGERATPYSVLSELSSRFSDADSNEQVLQRLAELLASGTGATDAVVWLRLGDRLRPEAVSGDEWPLAVELDGVEFPALPGDAAEPVQHGGELLGGLSISKERAQPVTSTDRQLLEDVAAGAGLLLRNIQLNAELAERADELRTSRRRLVAAQDAERRRLERNLHDGAQQQVVALKVKLGLAKAMAEREEADDIATTVSGLAEDTQRAVDGMRAAARGIYPPLLEAEGIRSALMAATREASLDVDVVADGLSRYPAELEATVYFSVLAAIGPDAGVSVRDGDGELTFAIDRAESSAGLEAVADRVDALGGTLEIERDADGRQRISGRLPATALEPA